MADVINLNRARKARDKAESKTRAAQNRVIHGRTGAEKAAARIETERLNRTLDGVRREDD